MEEQNTGFVIWITGMSKAGKTSLAEEVARRLAIAGRAVEVLDEANALFTAGLGSTREDRDAAARQVGGIARLFARHGVVAVCSVLSPHREIRDGLRRDLRRFVEVFVDCPMEVLLARDAGGVYEKALRGEVKNVTGIDDPYEPPLHPELVIHSDQEATGPATLRLCQALVDLKYLGPSEFVRLSGQRPRRSKPNGAARKGARRKMAAKAAARKAPRKAARGAKAERRAHR